jgi:hypothetical protein
MSLVSDFWDEWDRWSGGWVLLDFGLRWWIFQGGWNDRKVAETRKERVNRERLITAIGSNHGRFDFHILPELYSSSPFL